MKADGRPRVCLITEGSYPYAVGGTSSWTQQLLETLGDIRFSVVALCAEPKQPSDSRYVPPPNVEEVRSVVIGGPPVALKGRRPRVSPAARIEAEQMYSALLRGEWDAFGPLQRVLRKELGADDVFRSPWHWRIMEQYYRLMAPTEPFLSFYSAWRCSHRLLYQLMQTPLPEADVYHPISAGYAGFLGACGKTAGRGRLLLTEHGLYNRERELEIETSPWLRGYQRQFMATLFTALSRLAYAHADKIVSLFEAAREQQIEMGADPGRAVVVPNGVDVERLLRLSGRPRDGMIRIGLIGRVVPVKDVIAFIESAKVIAETLPNAEFEIIGPTDDAPSYVAACRSLVRQLRLEDRLWFTGYQKPEDYLPRLDLVVLTSLKESQPLSLLEAMAAGLPVVATRSGSLPEMLEDPQTLVWPRDVQGIAEAVIRLVRDEGRRRALGDAGRARVVERYDQRKNLTRYREFYHELMPRSPAEPAEAR